MPPLRLKTRDNHILTSSPKPHQENSVQLISPFYLCQMLPLHLVLGLVYMKTVEINLEGYFDTFLGSLMEVQCNGINEKV